MSAMDDYRRQVPELLVQANGLPDGHAKVALIERAVQLADAHQDLALGYQARVRLMGAALSAGQSDVLLVAFSWCLAQSERDPRHFPENDLLWQFRWVISELTEFVDVTKAQIEELFADMERRYRRAGSSMRAFHTLRRMVALDMGDRDAAVAAHERHAACPRDWLSDGPDAEAAFAIDYLIFTGQDEAAIRLAAPLLVRNAASPHHLGFIHAKLLLPLLKAGRAGDAMRSHLTGYRLVMRNPRYVPRFAEHLTFLALTENHARGFRLFERHLGDALATVSSYSRMHFYQAARLLLEQVAAAGRAELRMRLPAEFPAHSNDGRYDAATLAGWFAAAAAATAARFDARNGNDYYSRLFADVDSLKKMVTSVPLPRADG